MVRNVHVRVTRVAYLVVSQNLLVVVSSVSNSCFVGLGYGRAIDSSIGQQSDGVHCNSVLFSGLHVQTHFAILLVDPFNMTSLSLVQLLLGTKNSFLVVI